MVGYLHYLLGLTSNIMDVYFNNVMYGNNTMDKTIERSSVYFSSLMPLSYALPTLILRMADLIVATGVNSCRLSQLIQSDNKGMIT